MVDILIPALDKEYDFKLDEYAPISMLIEEIVEMICIHEQSILMGNEKQLMLCDLDKWSVFNKNENLSSYSVENGAKLMLV